MTSWSPARISQPGRAVQASVLGPCFDFFDLRELLWPQLPAIAGGQQGTELAAVGKRFVADWRARLPRPTRSNYSNMARQTDTHRCTSPRSGLSANLQEWWYSKQPSSLDPGTAGLRPTARSRERAAQGMAWRKETKKPLQSPGEG